jgi:hypothetical protein
VTKTEQEMAHPGGVKTSLKDNPVPFLTRETPAQRAGCSPQLTLLNDYPVLVQKTRVDVLIADV